MVVPIVVLREMKVLITVLTRAPTRSLLVTAKDAAVRLVLVDSSPIFPHATTTLDGFKSLTEDASHFTQEDIVKGDEPVGNVDNKEVDKYDPLDTVIADEGYDDELVE